MSTKFFDNITDRDKLHNHLLFCSSFILVDDNFISTWEQCVYYLYDNCKNSIINGDETHITQKPFMRVQWEEFEKYKKNNEHLKCFIECEYKQLKKKHNVKSGNPMFLWMHEHLFIESLDISILEKCRLQRNTYAHDLDNTLKHEITQAEKDLLKSLIDISERASQKWVYRVTIPSNKAKQHLVDFVDSAGNKIELKPENLLTGTSIFYSLVLSNLDNIW